MPKDSSTASPSRPWRGLLAGACLLLALVALPALASEKVRLAVPETGSVHWLLDVMKHNGLASAEGIELEVTPLASREKRLQALDEGKADFMVDDWLWVARQRHEGRDYTIVPLAVAVGAVMVRPDAHIEQLADLTGQRLGVAGGPLDQSWLLLRAYAGRELRADILMAVRPVFREPGLLNEQILSGQLPAILNDWNHDARLLAEGMRPLVTIRQMLNGLGINDSVPTIGWVFHEKWAKNHKKTVSKFLRAVELTQQRLTLDNNEWKRLRPMLKVEDDRAFAALRDTYRAGMPFDDPATTAASAARVFPILAREGGPDLVGDATELDPGTFWNR